MVTWILSYFPFRLELTKKQRILIDDQTFHHFAAICGQLKIVKFLIKSGADKEAKDKTGQIPLPLTQTCNDNA
jgi:ankyrin repeat protein